MAVFITTGYTVFIEIFILLVNWAILIHLEQVHCQDIYYPKHANNYNLIFFTQ